MLRIEVVQEGMGEREALYAIEGDILLSRYCAILFPGILRIHDAEHGEFSEPYTSTILRIV